MLFTHNLFRVGIIIINIVAANHASLCATIGNIIKVIGNILRDLAIIMHKMALAITIATKIIIHTIFIGVKLQTRTMTVNRSRTCPVYFSIIFVIVIFFRQSKQRIHYCLSKFLVIIGIRFYLSDKFRSYHKQLAPLFIVPSGKLVIFIPAKIKWLTTLQICTNYNRRIHHLNCAHAIITGIVNPFHATIPTITIITHGNKIHRMNRYTHSSFKGALISYLRNSNAEFLKYIIIFTATFLYQMMKSAKIFGARLNNDCLLRKFVLNRDRRFNINSVSCHIVCVSNNMNECVIRITGCAFKFAHKIMKKCAEFGQIGSFFPTII